VTDVLLALVDEVERLTEALEDKPPPADAVLLAQANRMLHERCEALESEVERLRARVAELEEEVSWGCEEGCGDCAGCEAGYAAAVARVRRE
jgi:predicted nuclease with TOPRIM domain